MSPEEERAQRSVERAFPDVARFLAGERAHGDLPVFGPGEVHRDDDTVPVVVVRVAYAMSREQLLTALSIGFTETGPERDPASLTDAEVRDEVEGWLAAASLIELDRYVTQGQLTAYPPETQAVMDALADAVDRAYPADSPIGELPVQQPRYGDGTVTLQTLDRGEVTLPEPAWCTGHDGEPVGHFADITHNGPHTTVTARTEQYGTVDILDARISHAPHAQQQPEPHPVVSARIDIELDLTVEDARPVAHALHVAGLRLARLAADTRHLRGGAR